MCDGGSKGSDVFFPTKKLRDAHWEVVGGLINIFYGCKDYDIIPSLLSELVLPYFEFKMTFC